MVSANSQRSTVTTASSVFRLFKEMPFHLIDEFVNHVRATGTPESFPDLHLGPLDNTEPFRTMTKFTIDRMKRAEGDMAYCPMCPQPNKYLNGAFIYLTQLQAIAAIGCECAAHETQDAAEKDYRARRDQRNEEDYLLTNLPFVPHKLAALQQARPAAKEAQRIFKLLRRDAVDAIGQLNAVKKKGGQLTVIETIDQKIAAVGPSGFRGSSGVQTRDVEFGSLAGTMAIVHHYNPIADLNHIEQLLNAYKECGSPEAALDAICHMTDEKRKSAVSCLRKADVEFRNFLTRIENFCDFFRADNIERINAWTQHPEHPAPFRITRREEKGVITLSIRGHEDRFYAIISPAIRTSRVNWPFAET